MKSYLDLVPISAKVHKKQNRMSILCIFLAVFLVTAIFGMADMFIRSQLLSAKMQYGDWHISIKDISDEEARLISARPEIKNIACYGTLNYRLDMGYTLADKDVLICGSDESYMTDIEVDAISEGCFPQTENEVLVGENAKSSLGLAIGDSISIYAPDGKEYQYTISGFSKNVSMIMKKDVYYVFLNTAAFRSIFPNPAGDEPIDYDSLFMVQFSNHRNIQESIADIKAQFRLSDEQVSENTMILGLIGQSSTLFMSQIYATAAVLSVLVLIAGILMIASSLNSNIAGRTEFFGMLRCIGTTPRQIMRLVRREALALCRTAIPVSITCGILVIWLLCALLRILSPQYFKGMPVFGISFPSIAAGIIIGILTVFLAARSPAKRAARVSPLSAVTGHANDTVPVRKAANTALMKIDTALGIHHAKENRKNFLLMTGSFALSIILFLSFTVTIDFMNYAITSLYPWTPDLSVVSPDNTCVVEKELLHTLQENPVVKRAYGRMFSYNIPISVSGREIENTSCDLISYDEIQFDWAKDYLVAGSIQDVIRKPNTGIIIYTPSYGQTTSIQVGDTVTLYLNGENKDIEIAAMISKCPFNTSEDSEIIICSEETFQGLTGKVNYTVIDMQLTKKAADSDVAAIRDSIGTAYTFSDRRMNNNEVKGTYYAFSLFLYGFLFLIALITICNIINCVAMNVSARMKQYGALRAIGLSHRQLKKMIIAQTCTYAVTGSVTGGILGLLLNRLLFEKMVTFRWGALWEIPYAEFAIILGIVIFSIILAVQTPLQKIRTMSIVDTIHS